MACLCLLAAATAFAQHYPVLPVPGAPHGIFTLMQDSRSALWMGTIDDVYCFDGEHFYSLRQYGFPRETANSFAEDSDGGIWIATQGTDFNGGTKRGGLYRYRAGHVEKILAGDGLSVTAAAPGVMLASQATELSGRPAFGDLYRIQQSKGTWKAERLLQNAADHLTVDHQGNILFPCPGGWCELSRDRVVHWQQTATLSVQHHEGSPLLERVLRDSEGCLWFRAEAFASYQCPGDPGITTLPKNTSQYDSSAHLEETADGSIFLLVYMALGRPGAFHIATQSNGLPGVMNTAMVARDGTIWIGGEAGLYRFMYPFQLEYWDKENGMTGPLSIARMGKDVFASSGDIRKLNADRTRWDSFPGSTGTGGPLAVGPENTLFSATRYLVTRFREQGGLLARAVLSDNVPLPSLLVTPEGEAWLGGNDVKRISVQGSRMVLHPEGLTQAGVRDIQYDAARHVLWACTGDGLFYRQNDRWGRITPKDGLLNGRCSSVGIDADGDLWQVYSSAAYAWIHNPASGHPEVRNFTQSLNDVAAYNVVTLLSPDRRGWLWRGSKSLDVAAPEAAKAGRWLRLDEQDGVSGMLADGHPFLSDPDGSVWLGTASSLLHFSLPANFTTHFPAPPVFVAGFPTSGKPATVADATGPVPRGASLTAHIGSLQFDRRNALHLRYRLLPEQTEWTEARSFDLPLNKPRWGKHRLQVQAQLATGPWSSTVEQSFTVMKPMWLTWPALAGFAAGGSLFIAGRRRWRAKRRARMKKAFPEIAALRLATFSPELQHMGGKLLDEQFEVGSILARGGFATVLRGRDRQQGNLPCAIKIFRQELMDKDWMARRFQQEVLALETIRHPNVVRIYGHGTTPDRGLGPAPWLVMELIDGTTLREELDHGSISPQQTASYLRQTGSALDEIHARGICHRDLKPENLMIRRAGIPGEELVLIDFSIALVKDPDQTMHGLSRAAGTLCYMAPEQVVGYADASTDIYSLSRIVIEMLTGQRLSDLLPDASMDLPARVRELVAGLPFPLSTLSVELIATALEFDPSRRPKNAGDFACRIAQDLESVVQPAKVE